METNAMGEYRLLTPASTRKSVQGSKLRPYQLNAIEQTNQYIDDGKSLGLIVMPTGSGKSKVISAIARQQAGKRVLIITPRVHLASQLGMEFGPDEASLVCATLKAERETDAEIVVATIQTLKNSQLNFRPDVILIDEVHMLPAEGEYISVVNRYDRAVVIGFTATPFQAGEQMISHEWSLIFEVNLRDLIQDGYLAMPLSISVEGRVGLVIDESTSLNETTAIALKNVQKSVKELDIKKPVVFGCNIGHAEFIAKELRAMGQNVVIVHSQMSRQDQLANYKEFRESSSCWLVNVSLVSVGVDLPCVDAIVFLRNVVSLTFLVQAIGRGLRLIQDKAICCVFDFGGGTERFKYIDKVSLSDAVNMKKTGLMPTKRCMHCNEQVHISSLRCQFCSGLLRDNESESRVRIKPFAKEAKLISDSWILKVSRIVVNDMGKKRYLFDGDSKLEGVCTMRELKVHEGDVVSVCYSRDRRLANIVGKLSPRVNRSRIA
jgi:DNA repair protein RadD